MIRQHLTKLSRKILPLSYVFFVFSLLVADATPSIEEIIENHKVNTPHKNALYISFEEVFNREVVLDQPHHIVVRDSEWPLQKENLRSFFDTNPAQILLLDISHNSPFIGEEGDLGFEDKKEYSLLYSIQHLALSNTGSQVTSLRDNFLCCCSGLTEINLSPLSQVTSVGDCFLSGCNSLTTVDLSSLIQLTSIGNIFLSGCEGLTTVNLSGLNQLTSVGDYCLSGCIRLTTTDLSSLSQLASVGDYFLSWCSGLTKVNFSGLGKLTSVGYGFLNRCNAIQSIQLGESPKKFFVHKTVNFLCNSDGPGQYKIGVRIYQHYLLELPQDLHAQLSQINL